MFNLKFRIKKIMYRDNMSRYTILRAILLSHDYKGNIPKEITIKGYFLVIYEKDEFEGIGECLYDETRGYFINLLTLPNLIIPEIEKSLVDFLHRRIKVLSVKKATEMINIFGLDFWDKIKNDYNLLTSIKGINVTKAKLIHDEMEKLVNFDEFTLFIQGLNIPMNLALKIYDEFGETSLSRVKSNPYIICYNYIIPFKYADKIAYQLGFEINDENRLKCAILNFIQNKSISNGDLYTDKSTLIKELNPYLNKIGEFKKNDIQIEEIECTLKKLVDLKKIVIEINSLGQDCLYLYYNNNVENNITENLYKIITEKKQPICLKEHINNYLDDYEHKYNQIIDSNQKEAIYMALLNNVSILTGGPGTGKTWTTNMIVQCIKSIKPYASILLLAPTGKASNRMKELTKMNASTIHRGLKIKPYTSTVDIEEIQADFVIVDESSMMDAYIFEKLTTAIGEDTRLLLVGDVEQLPSVGAGLILRDLIDSKKIPVVKLTKIFRQKENSYLMENILKIIKGKTTKDIDGIKTKCDDFILWNTESTRNIRNNLLKSIDKLMSNKYNFKFNDICILSPTKKGELGTDELNILLQSRYNPKSTTKTECTIDNIHVFRTGDRVIQIHNNYDKAIFNGDVGIIAQIYDSVENGILQTFVEVKFSGKNNDITYKKTELDELELAYCLTIHKAQGSEYPVIIIPIHEYMKDMLFRNLIYTGVSRAKSKCIIIGNETVFNEGINNLKNTSRYSLLKEKIIRKIA